VKRKNVKIEKRTLAAAAIAVALLAVTLSAWADFQKAKAATGPVGFPAAAASPSATSQNQSCVTFVEQRTVRGSSMGGVLSDGDVVSVKLGYYACNQPGRDEIALVHFAGDPNPLVKTIKAVPGDSFSLQQASCGWNIAVNGKILQNAQASDYCIGYSGYRMLSLYVQSYGGKIPQDAYLVLGNLVQGSTDSTRFGLVSRGSLLGKVEIPPKSG
jgi:signal peptidase I